MRLLVKVKDCLYQMIDGIEYVEKYCDLLLFKTTQKNCIYATVASD